MIVYYSISAIDIALGVLHNLTHYKAEADEIYQSMGLQYRYIGLATWFRKVNPSL